MPSAIKYPNDRRNPEGAIPVYIVAAPVKPPWPNNRGNSAAAIPIIFGAQPVSPNVGPIPVRVVAGAGTAPFGSDQGIDNNAIPVYESTAANAMPVVNVAPAEELLAPVTDVPPFITPTGIVNSGTVLTAHPGDWLMSLQIIFINGHVMELLLVARQVINIQQL